MVAGFGDVEIRYHGVGDIAGPHRLLVGHFIGAAIVAAKATPPAVCRCYIIIDRAGMVDILSISVCNPSSDSTFIFSI